MINSEQYDHPLQHNNTKVISFTNYFDLFYIELINSY